MFSKITFTFAILAVAQTTIAQSACILKSINRFEHPADQKTLCCSALSQVKSYLQEDCQKPDTYSNALATFTKSCQEAGYGSCSNSTSSSSSMSVSAISSVSGTAQKSGSAQSTGAPYPVVYTSTYYDTQCSCTKTTKVSSSGVAGSTGFATGTGASVPVATGAKAAGSPGSGSGSGAGAAVGTGAGAGASSGSPAATGSPISPASPATFTGAASKNIGSVAVGLLAVAGIAVAL